MLKHVEYVNTKDITTENQLSKKIYYNDILYRSRYDAYIVLGALNDEINKKSYVSLEFLYIITSMNSDKISNHDKKYGWTNLNDAQIVFCKNGFYKIIFPRPIPINI